MNLKIRKADSSISILLFIFNVFLSRQGTKEISLKNILDLLKPFGKNETAVRMGLSRGMQSGIFVNVKHGNEVFYQLTDKAVEYIEYWWKTVNQFQDKIPLQQSEWDRKWNLLYIENGKIYNDFVRLLKNMGYYSLNNCVWISPYNYSNKVNEIVKEMGLDTAIYMFQSELIENRKLEELVKQVWDVNKLAKKYIEYVNDLNGTMESMGKTLHYDGNSLPFLHQYGLKLFEIIEEDPQLPIELLPSEWQGIQAINNFTKFREDLLPSANMYINQVLNH